MKYLLLLFFPMTLLASPINILSAKASPIGEAWNFTVTVEHGDTGWEHYVTGWRIENEAGLIFGTLNLHHPHEDEQPFTRTLTNVKLPTDTDEVFIRARHLENGETKWHKKRFKLEIN